MELTVLGLDAAEPPMRFKHLWGRYPYGFRPWTHCIQCFKSHKAQGIAPTMKDGTIGLQDHLFYLCGVGAPESAKVDPTLIQRVTNVHIAVYPDRGSIVTVPSAYGVTFTIEGARRIEIEKLPIGFQNQPDRKSQCKNFQFAYQMFEVGEVPEDDGSKGDADIVYTLRDRWKSMPEIQISPR